MIKLSIIIVCYMNELVLRDCLMSIEKYNDLEDEIEVIIVDNSPSMQLHDSIKKDFPWIIMMKNENKGFGQGNNVGSACAKGEYLLFLNPDTILVESIFTEAIHRIEKDPLIGIAGMKLLNVDLDMNMSYHFLEEHTFFRAQLNKLFNKYNIFKEKNMYICGADMFMKKEVFEIVGKFDEQLFMYYEESDLTRRLHALGYHNCFFKELHLIHLEGMSTQGQKINRITIEREIESYSYYCNKFQIDFHKHLTKKRNYAKRKKQLYSLRKNPMVEYYQLAIDVYDEYL